MFTGQHSTRLLVIVLLIALLISACERPLNTGADDEENPTPLPTVVIHESQTATDEAVEESADPEGELEEAEDADESEQADEAASEAESETASDPEQESTEEALETEETPDDTNQESDEGGDSEEIGGAEEETAEEEAADEEAADESEPEETEEPVDESGDSGSAEDSEEAEDTTAEEEDQSGTAETSDEEIVPATHVVAAGENLYRISLLYGVTLAEMAAFNNIINVNQVYEGQILQIPGGVEEETPEPPEPPETPEPPEPTEPPVEPDEPPTEGVLYTVQLGDTLSQIGLNFGVSWVEIAEANGIVDPNEIYEGQVLKIPTSAPGPSPEFTHTVLPGESIRSISFKYGVAWLEIANANRIRSPYMIFPGQTLVIPGA